MTFMPNVDAPRIAIIGGGAAGLLAAGTALEYGARVTIFEHMPFLGKKLLITGKGRCNVTNDCDRDTFLSNVLTNPRFLYSALSAFTIEDTISLFEELGVPLKTERGRRVFPVSDKASDIVEALKKRAKGAEVIHAHVKALLTENGAITGVRADKDYPFDSVILATGGASYPLTGSDGSGYALARAVGHTISPLMPSLIPLTSPDPVCKELQGLSLKNVGLSLKNSAGKVLYHDFGEMLFTHFGISGPMVLSASTHLRSVAFDGLVAEIDLKAALDEKTLDQRLLSDFASNLNKDLVNAMSGLLPQKMIEPFIARTGVDPRKKVHDISKEERGTILHTLKHFTIPLSGFRPLEEAIVTAGGIKVSEIDPKTMQSKLVHNLYFAGEVIDVDAYTGGYSLQIAFSTGYLAAIHAATNY